MSKRAFVFPGQGAQSVGMGKSLYENNSLAKGIMDEADRILGYSLTELCFNGPDDRLKQTQYAQPALYTVSFAVYSILKEKGIQPDYLAGHSLGEYSALAVGGVFDFASGLKLVAKRGELMAEAAQSKPGTMAAVLGMTADEVRDICQKISATQGIVVPANFNSPGQIVISGEIPAIQATIAALKEMKKKAIPLPVSGGFHSPLLNEANESFSNILDEIEFKDSNVPIVSNVTAQPSQSGVVLKEAVRKQMISSVLWEDTIHILKSLGVGQYIEIGSGAVLSGLIKKTDKEATTLQTGDMALLETTLQSVSASSL